MTDLTPEDIAAAREEGELVALLLMAAGLTVTMPKQRAAAETPDSDPVHIVHPGAWPTGTNRPAPVPPASGPQIDAALNAYRRWYLDDQRSAASNHCPCTGCTPGGIT